MHTTAKTVINRTPMRSIRSSRSALAGLVAALLIGLATGPFVWGQESSDSPESKQDPAARHAPELAIAQRERIRKAVQVQVDDLKKRADELWSRQQELRTRVRKECGLSPENVTPILLRLERDRFTLEIEAKLKKARRDRLADLVAKEIAIARADGKDDAIVEHLNQIVAARRGALAAQQVNREKRTGSELGVKQAEADLAEAEIRLALRKQELGKSPADGGIERLNQQLRDVSLDVTQDELRLELLQERLKSLGAVQELLDQYKVVCDSELPRVLRLLEQSQTQLGQVEIGLEERQW